MEGSVKNLLDAERESQAIVDEAMKNRGKMLNEARVNAEREINKHRADYDKKFEEEKA